ncbi:glycosyltransferase [Rhodococcus sp. MALMAid1271]|uniref:glycosyltransferase n=1 Tax=Rhodococcus sp. MALMAid1271 TaxID=3411744 RepID=UPI003BA02F08
MKILICMASIAVSKGGPTTAAHALSAALAEQGHSVTVLAHDDGLQDAGTELPGRTYSVHKFRLTTKIWQFSIQYLAWVSKNVGNYDFVLINSLFLSHTTVVSFYARRNRVPYAIRPHGSLNVADLQKNAIIKRLYLKAIDNRNLKNAKFIFCTSEAEVIQLQKRSFQTGRVIPLGVDTAYLQARRIAGDIQRKSLLYIGRITKKKNVHLIIMALSELNRRGLGFRATIAGPDDENLKSELVALATEHGVDKDIDFLGFIDKERQLRLQATAGIFILPSNDENFGIAVAESMAVGIPVIISKGVSHSSHVDQYGGGVVVERDHSAIAQAAEKIANLDENIYIELCNQARSLVARQYDWLKSADRLVEEICTVEQTQGTTRNSWWK